MSALIDPVLLQTNDGPHLRAVMLTEQQTRVTPTHRHLHGQLFGASQGLLSVHASNGWWVVPASHAVWIPPSHDHALRSHGAFSGWSVYVVPANCAELPPSPCILRTSGLLREAVARASQWDRRQALNPPQQRLADVILDEIASLPHEPLGLPLPVDSRLLRITQALLNDLSDERTLDQWASWAGLSPRTLSRRFVAETGFSFAEWRQRARVMRALEMLAADMSVTTIALNLGYRNVSAFIAMFRNVFGTTPGRYVDPTQY